jgi:multiple sugar transport system permease protein
MVTIPGSLLEASIIDGARIDQIFINIICPLSIPPLATAFVLSLSNSWNMVEQPLVFLKSAHLHPLSLALLRNQFSNSVIFAAASIYFLPIFFFFLFFSEEFDKGIQAVDLK